LLVVKGIDIGQVGEAVLAADHPDTGRVLALPGKTHLSMEKNCACQSLDQGGFAAPGMAYDGQSLTRGNRKIDVLQDHPAISSNRQLCYHKLRRRCMHKKRATKTQPFQIYEII
jgi:hypothetical protein